MDDKDEGMDPDSAAISAILDLLDKKSAENMKTKHGPKDEAAPAVGQGHIVTVKVHSLPKPGEDETKDDKDEAGLTPEMLKSLMGEPDGDEKED